MEQVYYSYLTSIVRTMELHEKVLYAMEFIKCGVFWIQSSKKLPVFGRECKHLAVSRRCKQLSEHSRYTDLYCHVAGFHCIATQLFTRKHFGTEMKI